MNGNNKVLSGIYGVCIGDALGVPVEFKSRRELRNNQVVDMIGYGTWNQPSGTWSDDSSLMLCLADSLCNGFNIDDIGEKFCKWYYEGYWTPHEEVFDIGNGTYSAIAKIQKGVKSELAGGTDESNNGNGSLMRILPLAFYLENKENIHDKIEIVHKVSSITHGHIRSKIACSIYIEFAINILKGLSLKNSYNCMTQTILEYYSKTEHLSELQYFKHILNEDISRLPEDYIQSSGYVIDTLEASLWCLMNSSSYAEAVLKAVNLGEDTDTTGAVTGGIAGLYYGYMNIPKRWVDKIARKDDIFNLSCMLSKKVYGV